ncbi:hypothetical protein CEXT_393971 [Caerostris extrusa]|uniref:Uncharacterized protein n=1 Tax=Caerostris extrusa TaxID=172846 RepID=A0AAV4T0C4_CAEEX|nr:hypothetical protein CEXT_393971 [Caerostris extrusa]
MEKGRRTELYNPLEIRFQDSCFLLLCLKFPACVTDIPQNAFSNNDALQVVGKEAALPTGGVFLLKRKKARHLIAEYILQKIEKKEKKKKDSNLYS